MEPLKKLLASLFLFATITVQSQTIFTYGNKPVSKEEFLKAYNKNATETKPDAKAYREYLDLYIRFKLKVQAALDSRLDTLPSQKSELRSFRSQVASAYMNDEESVNKMIDEAIQRSGTEVRLSHIFVQLPMGASEEQVKKAQEKINLAYSRLQKGEDFGKLAAELSEDPSAVNNKGNIGYITVFTLPYDLENLAYSTPLGKFSAPYKSKIGYHIFKKEAERKALGKIRVAQVLLAFPPDVTPAKKQQLAQLADSLYKALQKGADFKQIALQFSNDNISYQNGGELMEFGIGKYEADFENAAFALANDGDISAPFTTSYGYHILKRLQVKTPNPDKNDKANREEMRQLISQNDRMEVAKKNLVKKVFQQTGYKKMPVNEKSLFRITDSVMESKKTPALPDLKSNTVLFSFPGQNIRLQDWINYLEASRAVQQAQGRKPNRELFDLFVETTALEYYRDHLEQYNKEFAYQLKEFREGNLLFEIMQRKIWDRASADTAGLKAYYNSRKNNYWWEASADALIFTASNDSVANALKENLEKDYKNWRQWVDNSNGAILGDSGRFELGQIPVVERTAFSEKLITAPVKNETDNSLTFAYIIKMYNNREPRSFNDARGFVINDYQGYLEERWIAELKKKYPVKVNEAVLKSLAD